jgi:hypothetical protein
MKSSDLFLIEMPGFALMYFEILLCHLLATAVFFSVAFCMGYSPCKDRIVNDYQYLLILKGRFFLVSIVFFIILHIIVQLCGQYIFASIATFVGMISARRFGDFVFGLLTLLIFHFSQATGLFLVGYMALRLVVLLDVKHSRVWVPIWK